MRLSGVFAGVLGRLDEAIDLYHQVLELDPLSAAAYQNLGLAHAALGNHAPAEEAFRKALELAPQRIASHAQLSFLALARGRPEEALAEAMREPEPGYRLCAIANAEDALGHRMESDAVLQQLMDDNATHFGLQVAEVFALRGETDKAFHWLDRAYESRDAGLAYVGTNPRLRGLHGDARWTTLLRRMGLR
jgi:tetratricopeptide (TPR) repeat protein